MFRGSIPPDMQAIIGEIVKNWPGPDIFVGCSGNFTVERVLHAVRPDLRIHANDVTMFSGVIGAYLADQPVDLKISDRLPEFAWLSDYMDKPVDRVATLMLATRITDAIAKDGGNKDNTYYERLIAAYKNYFADLHAKTVSKIEAVDWRLASYFNGDVMDLVGRLPDGAGFITYPPFTPGDYTNMYAKLDLLFDWQHPTFVELTDNLLDSLYKKIIDREYWVIGSDNRMSDLEPYLAGVTRTTNRGVPLYVYYSKRDVRRVVTPEQKTVPVANERLRPRDEIGGKLTLSILDYKQFQALRSQYMNRRIKPGAASLAAGVMVDGYLVGAYAFSSAPHPGEMHHLDALYLLSDFPVAPTDYPKLAKLVLYAALSKESILLAERTARRRVRFLATTAFSNNPSSMKYRGLFKVANRQENKKPPEPEDRFQGKRFMINYVAEGGGWTLQEGLAIWKKRFGERDANKAQEAE